MNLVHDLSPGSEDAIRVVVEIPRGSKNKYEIDKDTGLVALDRTLHTAQDYPVDYGFVPQTLWDDNDPLDVCIFTTHPLHPGIIVYVRPVGILRVEDSGEGDDKILSVPVDDPRFDKVQDVEDLNQHHIREVQHFLETYKDLQDKKVIVKGIEGASAAREAFKRGCQLYTDKFGGK